MTAKEVADAIRSMQIRGAAEIARRAAIALKDEALSYSGKDIEEFKGRMEASKDLLLDSRPTAVSLWNGVQSVVKKTSDIGDVEEYRSALVQNADKFVLRSNEALKIIGHLGANRIQDGDRVLTHCNSKAALSAIITAWQEGKKIEAVVTESRPWRQGVLSANDLAKAGVPTTMIVDSAVRHTMRSVDAVFVGADTICSNGALINKIGTSQVALAAHESRVPFMVCAETFKFSPRTIYGEMVQIEERGGSEIVRPGEIPDSVKIFNPVFDATPPEYIDLMVTEVGIIPPFAAYEIIVRELGQEFIFNEH
jgi:ribose 1,5-bisphosphate isomerase